MYGLMCHVCFNRTDFISNAGIKYSVLNVAHICHFFYSLYDVIFEIRDHVLRLGFMVQYITDIFVLKVSLSLSPPGLRNFNVKQWVYFNILIKFPLRVLFIE